MPKVFTSKILRQPAKWEIPIAGFFQNFIYTILKYDIQ